MQTPRSLDELTETVEVLEEVTLEVSYYLSRGIFCDGENMSTATIRKLMSGNLNMTQRGNTRLSQPLKFQDRLSAHFSKL